MAGVVSAAVVTAAVPADAVSEASIQFAADAAQLSSSLLRNAELAQKESQDAAVRAFAARLAKESTRVNDALLEICRRKGIKLPAVGSGPTSGALPDTSGQTFDRVFTLEASQALARADTLFSAASAAPKVDEDLQAFARQSRKSLLELSGPAAELAKAQAGMAGQRQAR